MDATSEFLQDLFGLQGKTAVVFGGTGELCSVMAQALARVGCEVVLVGRIREKAEKHLEIIRKHGGQGYYSHADVTSRKSLHDLLERVLTQSGKVDILINGVGLNSDTPFLEIEEEEFQRILDTNLTATFRTCQVFGQYFIEEGIPASIINIGSMTGIVPLSHVFTYSAAKAAVHNLSRNLAREWAEHSIRVNTIIPGFFPAAHNRRIFPENRVLEILRHTPMNRFGNPPDLIGATLMLASNSASAFLTGSEIIVDGGFNAMKI